MKSEQVAVSNVPSQPEVETIKSTSRKRSVPTSDSNVVVTNTVTNVNTQPEVETVNTVKRTAASRKRYVPTSASNDNAVSNVPSQPEEGNKPANKPNKPVGGGKRYVARSASNANAVSNVASQPEVETIKRTACANVGRKHSVVTNMVTNVNAQPEVETIKKTACANVGRKHSVRTSASNVPAKSRRLESFDEGKTDTDHEDQEFEVIDIAGSSSSEGTNKENVVSVAPVQSRKRKVTSLGIVMQQSSSSARLSEVSDGTETDGTNDEEERFRKQFRAKNSTSSSKGEGKTLGVTKLNTELQQRKEQSRASWFDPNKFDSKRIKHPKKVVKELPDDAQIYCTKCNEVFRSTDELTAHEKECFKGRRYKCTDNSCSKMFSQKSLMHQHYKAVHLNDPFLCSFCQEPFVYKKSLEKHENTRHQTKKVFKYNCKICPKQTDDRTEFQVHMNRHTNVKPYKCNICEASYYSQSQLTAHLRTSCNALSDDKFECSVCGKKLSTEDHYREHFKGQHVDTVQGTIFYCEVCISRFFTEKAFNRHCKNCTG